LATHARQGRLSTANSPVTTAAPGVTAMASAIADAIAVARLSYFEGSALDDLLAKVRSAMAGALLSDTQTAPGENHETHAKRHAEAGHRRRRRVGASGRPSPGRRRRRRRGGVTRARAGAA